MLNGVEIVMQFVRPAKKDDSACRRDTMHAISMIAIIPAFVSPNVLVQRLRKVRADFKAAHRSVTQLPPGLQKQWCADSLLKEMASFCQKSEGTANSLIVLKSSGGSQSNRTAAMKKQIAAEQAYDLLKDWGRRTPSTTKGGPFHELTKLLFKAATGKKRTGDVARVCARVIQSLRSGPSRAS